MRSKPSKVGIVGAGHVGAEVAYAFGLLRICDHGHFIRPNII
jgi:malate/lactate dehydrogenase